MRFFGLLLAIVCSLGCSTSHVAGDRFALEATQKRPVWPFRFTKPLVDASQREMLADDASSSEVIVALSVGSKDEDTDVHFLDVFGQSVVAERRTWIDQPIVHPTFIATTTRLPSGKFEEELAAHPDAPLSFRISAVNRTEFVVRLPEGQPRGMIFSLASWGGREQEEVFQKECIKRGWIVVAAAAPMISRSRFEVDVDAREEIGEAARKLALEVDERTADAAYHFESFLLAMEKHHPEWLEGPLVLVGFSAGSLAIPAIATRLKERFSAAVFYGSGADFARASLLSTFSGRPFRVNWGEGLGTAEDEDRFCELYREASSLDPFHTAVACRSIPALVIRARWDRIVPAACGELLWERLGQPDSYTLLWGHIYLFWRLPSWSSTIADWIDAATSPAES